MTNGANDKEAIRMWIAERLEEVREDGACAVMSVLHWNSYGQEVDLHTMRAGTKNWGDAERMADIFDGVATRHARGIPGMQQLQMVAFFGSNAIKPQSVLPFMRVGATHFGSTPGGGLATEAPTQVGQTAQGMRLAEIVTSAAAAKDKVLFEIMRDVIRELRADCLRLSEDNRELFVALRQELITTVRLGHEQKMNAMRFVREASERKQLIMLLPAFANAITGREVFPVSAQDTALVENLCTYCGEDDIKRFATLLGEKNPNLSGLLMERFSTIKQKRLADMNESEAIVKEVLDIDPEHDIAGIATSKLRKIAVGSLGLDSVDVRHAGGDAPPKQAPPEEPNDTKLLNDLFATVPAARIDMMAQALAEESPELAERIKKRAMAAKEGSL